MKFISLTLLILIPCIAWGAPIVDITQIAGKTKAEVAHALGDPDRIEKRKDGDAFHYAKGDTEMVYINDKADWITVSALGEVPFTSKALTSLGFKETAPSFQNANVIRWASLPGLLAVAIFPGRINCDYALVEVASHSP